MLTPTRTRTWTANTTVAALTGFGAVASAAPVGAWIELGSAGISLGQGLCVSCTARIGTTGINDTRTGLAVPLHRNATTAQLVSPPHRSVAARPRLRKLHDLRARRISSHEARFPCPSVTRRRARRWLGLRPPGRPFGAARRCWMPGCEDQIGAHYGLCPRHLDGFVYAIRVDEDHRRERYASERIDARPVLSARLTPHRRRRLIDHLARRVQFTPGGGYQLPDALELHLSALSAKLPDRDTA